MTNGCGPYRYFHPYVCHGSDEAISLSHRVIRVSYGEETAIRSDSRGRRCLIARIPRSVQPLFHERLRPEVTGCGDDPFVRGGNRPSSHTRHIHTQFVEDNQEGHTGDADIRSVQVPFRLHILPRTAYHISVHVIVIADDRPVLCDVRLLDIVQG